MYAVQGMESHAQNGRDAEVLEAAKLSFLKRTRVLYRYTFPNISNSELRRKVLADWDSSSETEKQFHVSKVTHFNNRTFFASIFSVLPGRMDRHVVFNL
jgi:hypothetical protein